MLSLAIGLLGGLAVLVAVCLVVDLKALGKLDEWHHGYAVMLAFPLSDSRLELLRILPLLIAADDAWQHYRQLDMPWYRSPLNRAWRWYCRRGRR